MKIILTRLIPILLLLGPAPLLSAGAQTNPGAICVSAYADTNGNGIQDPGETTLAGVKVRLLLAGAIVATHITTTAEDVHCFDNLTPGIYTVRFADSPTYQITTSSEGTFDLAAGQRLTIDPVGAVPGTINWNIQAVAAEPNAICVSAFEDQNQNKRREAEEPLLGGVNVNLSAENVIIATHLTGTDGPYCFEDLDPDIYTITFTGSPLYRATSPDEVSVALANGQRLTLDGFGAVTVPADNIRAAINAQAVAAQPDEEPLAQEVRLLLATAGSMIVMLIMIGVGAMILVLNGWRRSRRARPAPPKFGGPARA